MSNGSPVTSHMQYVGYNQSLPRIGSGGRLSASAAACSAGGGVEAGSEGSIDNRVLSSSSPGFDNSPLRHGGSGTFLRQYYVAVDRQQFKMSTLIDLVEVLGQHKCLPVAIACSSRDVLDALAAAISPLKQFTVSLLHSDESEMERGNVIEGFRRTVGAWSLREEKAGGNSAHILIATDVCLPMSHFGEPMLGARLLINYDLPPKKEAYVRRLSACVSHHAAAASFGRASTGSAGAIGALSSTSLIGGIVINFVVAGEVDALRNIEESCNIIIEEMPINISELL